MDIIVVISRLGMIIPVLRVSDDLDVQRDSESMTYILDTQSYSVRWFWVRIRTILGIEIWIVGHE